jgi:hypothetical protein
VAGGWKRDVVAATVALFILSVFGGATLMSLFAVHHARSRGTVRQGEDVKGKP